MGVGGLEGWVRFPSPFSEFRRFLNRLALQTGPIVFGILAGNPLEGAKLTGRFCIVKRCSSISWNIPIMDPVRSRSSGSFDRSAKAHPVHGAQEAPACQKQTGAMH